MEGELTVCPPNGDLLVYMVVDSLFNLPNVTLNNIPVYYIVLLVLCQTLHYS
jgi:hypothetical protein